MKYFNYSYDKPTTTGTIYFIDNAKTVVFNLSSSNIPRGVAWIRIAGNDNQLMIKPNYNNDQDILIFRADVSNSVKVNFLGVIFYE